MSGRRVLIVDDEKWICAVLQDYLEEAGYAVDTAHSLEDARQRVHEANLPDVVVLDLTLPDGSGLALLREVKNDAKTSALPVIILTAQPLRESEKDRIFSERADDYLPKPFKLAEFRERIEAQLRSGHAGDAPSTAA